MLHDRSLFERSSGIQNLKKEINKRSIVIRNNRQTKP